MYNVFSNFLFFSKMCAIVWDAQQFIIHALATNDFANWRQCVWRGFKVGTVGMSTTLPGQEIKSGNMMDV
jgi:hypothetical protein